MEDEDEEQGVSILTLKLVPLIEFKVRCKGGMKDEKSDKLLLC